MEDSFIIYHLTQEQAEKICAYFDVEMNGLDEYEIAELLDRFLDENL